MQVGFENGSIYHCVLSKNILGAPHERVEAWCKRRRKKKPGGFAPGEAACFRTAYPKMPAGLSPVKATCSLKKGAR
jgi:hypothetical protein